MLCELKMRLRANTFAAQALTLFAGSAGGQLVSVAAAPILTRLYSPAEFGTLAAFSAVIAVLTPLATLRYELALPLVRSDAEAANLLALMLPILLVAGLLAVPAAWALSSWPVMGMGAVAAFAPLAGAGLFAIGVYQSLVYEATRRAAYPAIARTKWTQAFTAIATQIGLGLAGGGAWGLLLGMVLGQSGGAAGLARRLLPALPRQAVSRAAMLALARRFIRFPLFSSWSAVVSAAGAHQMLIVWAAAVHGPALAGAIFLAERVVGRPMVLVTSSVLQVYVGELGRLCRSAPEQLRPRFLAVTSRLALMAALWCGAVAGLAPTFVPPVFGAEWSAAVPVLQLMAAIYMPQAVLHGVAHTLNVLERQKLGAVWEVARLSAVAAVLFWARHRDLTPVQALSAYAAVQAFCLLVNFLLLLHAVSAARKPAEEVNA